MSIHVKLNHITRYRYDRPVGTLTKLFSARPKLEGKPLVPQWPVEIASREDLCANKKVQQMMMERVSTLQQSLAHYEQIKRITLIAHHFSMESGELTNTLKMRRPVIYKNFKEEIDRMYEE